MRMDTLEPRLKDYRAIETWLVPETREEGDHAPVLMPLFPKLAETGRLREQDLMQVRW